MEQLEKRQRAETSDTSQLPELLRELKEQACTPSLDVSTLLLAVAEEISRNHFPKETYEVRISDD
jgi:hypothetical protein